MVTLQRISAHPLTGLSGSYDRQTSLVIPEFQYALSKLQDIVSQVGGKLFVKEAYRTFGQQTDRHRKYNTDRAGQSMHNAARAVDVHIQSLDFDYQVETDFVDILSKAAEHVGAYAHLHDDKKDCACLHYYGDWITLKDKVPHTELVKAMCIDAGLWEGYSSNKLRIAFVQSQLVRIGKFDVGMIDGILGKKTQSVLDDMGLDINLDETVEVLKRLPSYVEPVVVVEKVVAKKKVGKKKAVKSGS